MKKISAEIVADSINSNGNRITTFLLTYPRFIHGEIMTHRVFSRNSASSRAIPFEKMVKMVEEDPFIPIAWQKDHKGMQGTEYITDKDSLYNNNFVWLQARDEAVLAAKELNEYGATKQLVNRLLEPYMWHTVLVTATEFDNFFDLRCPKYELEGYRQGTFRSKKDAMNAWEGKGDYPNSDLDWYDINKSQAEIHIQALAEAMWDVYNENKPELLKPNQWHIPFNNRLDSDELYNKLHAPYNFDYNHGRINLNKVAIATARCARLSYMTFDGKIDYEKDIKLHDQLLESKHLSCFEHIAKCPEFTTNDDIRGWEKGFTHCDVNDNLWSGNFKGWIQYRQLI